MINRVAPSRRRCPIPPMHPAARRRVLALLNRRGD